jgi:nicotinamide-nucleotide amidase
MIIEIVSIGDELLRGKTLNSNCQYLSKKLALLGLDVSMHKVIKDDAIAIDAAFSDALLENRLTLFTGGLGPTIDDITKKLFAKSLNAKLVLDEDIKADLIKRFGPHLSSLDEQSHVIDKAIILPNTLGTAPGFLFVKDKTFIALMPGVPLEMREMYELALLPYLIRFITPLKRKKIRQLFFSRIVEVDVDPYLKQLHQQNPLIEFGIYPSHGFLSVSIQSLYEEMLDKPYQFLKERFSDYFFESPSGTLEEAIHLKFIEKGWSLSGAESCTGGLIASSLTRYSGSSRYFKGSLVAYSNEVKMNVLNVSIQTLENHGAVSRECVLSMAEGALNLFKTTCAFAVSGIAGPLGGSLEKPVGTVWASIVFQNGDKIAWQFYIDGNREIIMECSKNEILGVLLSKL